MQDEIYRFVLAWLKQSSRAGSTSFSLPLASEIAATATSWAIFGVGVQWSRGTGSANGTSGARRPPVEQVVRQVSALLVNGLAPHGRATSL